MYLIQSYNQVNKNGVNFVYRHSVVEIAFHIHTVCVACHCSYCMSVCHVLCVRFYNKNRYTMHDIVSGVHSGQQEYWRC